MFILRFIANQLAPLTLLGAITAYFIPEIFLIFSLPILGMKLVLWMFAITMFGLGLVLETDDLKQTLQKPIPIGLGLLTQFSVMPLLGFTAAWISGLPPEIALGLIIVGCAPGAMASNVIVFLAGGALAFSITLTFIATLLAPVITPSLVKWLGGAYFQIPFWGLFFTILKILVIPLLLGMIIRYKFIKPMHMDYVRVISPAMGALAIIIICSHAVAANQERLSQVGVEIFSLVVIVNALGYLAGWTLSRLYRFNHAYRITLAIEIGMQNAGLGVALALAHFGPETALPGALFAFWSVITAAIATRLLKHRGLRKTAEPVDAFAD
ncbi:MAG: bile acid:sodium symporter family protein [Gammaproteobacteria bacterium]|nr:MAG: bile acid:sodium symporter family protein [Gammaproteobacteria bacterium]